MDDSTIESMLRSPNLGDTPEKRLSLREVWELYRQDAAETGRVVRDDWAELATTAMHEPSPEYCLRQAETILRNRDLGDVTVTMVIDKAVLPGQDENGDGYADANPDTGAGAEPGNMSLGLWRESELVVMVTENDPVVIMGDADAVVAYLISQL